MIINLVLLGLIFGASKKKMKPYVGAALLGAVKGVMYFLALQRVEVALGAFLVFGGLAAGLVYFMARVDRKEEGEEPYSNYSSKKKSPFKWEYVPLSCLVFLLVFGEGIANMAALR
ncbi:MAG: hypothetical protein JNN01_18000 [Opitutaceae bacterium]|nr:hypothetical protein [Opitutaceae bacterium]